MIDRYRDIKGSRKVHHVLSADEIEKLKEDILGIDADIKVFDFNNESYEGTCYLDEFDIVIINGNVLPDVKSGSVHPRDIMSTRAVIAHEYYGHRTYRNTKLEKNSWEDEYRASRTAAEITPNLTDEERRHLVMDALERKREAGIVPVPDDFEKKVLYREAF